MEEAFGSKPIVISYPRVERISEDDDLASRSLQFFIAGKTDSLEKNFQNAHNGSFYFNPHSEEKNREINGFTYVPQKDEKDFLAVGPCALSGGKDGSLKNAITTDDWPFLYMRTPGISQHYMKGIIVLLVLTFVFIFSATGFRVKFFQPRYFFLGAAFMLLETLGVVRFSLLYGSTWFSNVMVFTAVLFMVLCANIYVIKREIPKLSLVYLLLFVSIVLNLFINPSHFVGSPAIIKYTVPAIILFLPLFFAGIVFACFFKSETKPQDALASNIFGSMVGGVLEYFSLYMGFTALLFFVLALYMFSWFTRRT